MNKVVILTVVTITGLVAGEAVPAATAAEIIADSAGALAANQSQAADLVAVDSWWTWGIAGALAILGVSRSVAPGIWGVVANIVYSLLATKRDRDIARKEKRLAEVADVVVHQIEDVDDSVIKERVADAIGDRSELNDVIREILS